MNFIFNVYVVEILTKFYKTLYGKFFYMTDFQLGQPVEELKTWVALTLPMGIVKKPALRMYWSTDAALNTPYFGHVMARDRYFQVLRYLQFANNNEEIKR